MKKITVKEVIKEIYEDDNVFKTKHIFKSGKHKLEVVFVDNTEYHQSLIDDKKASLYLFDEKGRNHLLLITKNNYEKTFKDLYKPDIILSNLNFYIKKKTVLTIAKTTFIFSILLVVIANLFIILEYGLDKVFYIPLISIVLLVIVFLLNGKLLNVLYNNIQKELVEELEAKHPNIKRRMEQEKKYIK